MALLRMHRCTAFQVCPQGSQNGCRDNEEHGSRMHASTGYGLPGRFRGLADCFWKETHASRLDHGLRATCERGSADESRDVR
jgi:hypothetical protein